MRQITTSDTRATQEDSRADTKTVWTVTEDEELFKKDTTAVVQALLPDAVLWYELATRGNKSGPTTQRAWECDSKRVLHYARMESPWAPVQPSLYRASGSGRIGCAGVLHSPAHITSRQRGPTSSWGKSEGYKDKGVSQNHGLVSMFGLDGGSLYSAMPPIPGSDPSVRAWTVANVTITEWALEGGGHKLLGAY